MLFHM